MLLRQLRTEYRNQTDNSQQQEYDDNNPFQHVI